MNQLIPADQFAKEATNLLHEEIERVKNLTEEEFEAELAAMSPADRLYVETGLFVVRDEL